MQQQLCNEMNIGQLLFLCEVRLIGWWLMTVEGAVDYIVVKVVNSAD